MHNVTSSTPVTAAAMHASVTHQGTVQPCVNRACTCCLMLSWCCHAGKDPFNPAQMFSTAHADAINTLQHLSKALTRLQMAAQKAAITAALQVRPSAMLVFGMAVATYNTNRPSWLHEQC